MALKICLRQSWNNTRVFRPVLVLVLIFFVQISCSPLGLSTTKSPAIVVPPTNSVIQPAPESAFRVNTWVNNPTPVRGSQVILRGSLIKYGAILSGIMMQAAWPPESGERQGPNCFVMVTYGTGVCIIETGSYPVGKIVPITVTFQYGGRKYFGYTSFTIK